MWIKINYSSYRVHDIAKSQKDELRDAYQQLLHEASQEDVNSGEG